MRVCRLPLLLMAALLISAATFVAVPERAEARGFKSIVAKVGTVAAEKTIRRSGKNNERDEDSAPEASGTTAAPAQVTAAAEPVPAPVVAAAPLKLVAPPNTGLVCLAGCYDGQGRRVPSL